MTVSAGARTARLRVRPNGSLHSATSGPTCVDTATPGGEPVAVHDCLPAREQRHRDTYDGAERVGQLLLEHDGCEATLRRDAELDVDRRALAHPRRQAAPDRLDGEPAAGQQPRQPEHRECAVHQQEDRPAAEHPAEHEPGHGQPATVSRRA